MLIKILRSSLFWYSFPFLFCLILLELNHDMPYYDFSKQGISVFIFFIFLPYIFSYNIAAPLFRNVKLIKFNLASFFANKINFLFKLWVIISFFEILFFGGLPILNIVTGGTKTYADFGLPTLHGFANFIWWILVLNSIGNYLNIGKISKRDIFIILWPFLVLSRGLVIILILQYFSSYIYHLKKIKFKFILYFSIILVAMYFIFGYIGDLRSADFSLTDKYSGVNSSSTFLWFYVYVTSPYVNLLNTINNISPAYSIIPYATVSGFVPSIFKSMLGFEVGFDAYIGAPIAAFLNAGTAFRSPYLDYGISGIISQSIFFGLLSALIKIYNVKSKIVLPYYNGILALNIFNNNLFNPVFFLILVFLLYKKNSLNHV